MKNSCLKCPSPNRRFLNTVGALAIVLASTSGCRTATELAPTRSAESARTAPDSNPASDPASDSAVPEKYPDAFSDPDSPLVLYDNSLQAYRNFSGQPGDQAMLGGVPIVKMIAENKSRDGQTIPGLSTRPHLIEKHLLNGTPFEPISLPKQAILKKLQEFQQKYWRHAPGVEWDAERIPKAERRDFHYLYGTLSTFPEDHSLRESYRIYTLADCLTRFRPPVWGPLQINYYCMIPAGFRACTRFLYPGHSAMVMKRIESNPRLHDPETHRMDREVILASCLTVGGKRDDPFWDRLVRELRFPREVGITSGPELFDLVQPNKPLVKATPQLLLRAVNASMKWVGERGWSEKQKQALAQRVVDDTRKFYESQYMTIDGKTINLYRYIMHAPVLKFKIKDQMAILNSLYSSMSQTDGSGKPYWPEIHTPGCPAANYVHPEGLPALPEIPFQTCDPEEFIYRQGIGSSGR